MQGKFHPVCLFSQRSGRKGKDKGFKIRFKKYLQERGGEKRKKLE